MYKQMFKKWRWSKNLPMDKATKKNNKTKQQKPKNTKNRKNKQPKHHQNDRTVRLGGTADLTIQYDDYQIVGAKRVNDLSTLESPPEPDFSRAQR